MRRPLSLDPNRGLEDADGVAAGTHFGKVVEIPLFQYLLKLAISEMHSSPSETPTNRPPNMSDLIHES